MRHIRRGQAPVKIPFQLRSSSRVLAQWADEVRTSLRNLRDRIPQTVGGGGISGSGGCIPWKPSFTVVSDINYVTFNLGLLNQIAADNWNTALTIAPDATVWPTLDVTASNGKITGYTIELETSPPTEDQQNDNTPPSSFKIVLGVIESLNPCMVVTENLEAVGTEVFRKSRTPSSPGEEPFTRVWRWKVNANNSGDYPYIT